jgi:hypothetical protein
MKAIPIGELCVVQIAKALAEIVLAVSRAKQDFSPPP